MQDSTHPSQQDEAHTAAVQGLFLQYQPAIRGYVLSIVPDFSMADDVVQETFLVVTRKAASFELGTSFAAWVKTIARYKALEAIRSAKRKFESLSEEVIEVLSVERHEFIGDVDVWLGMLASCIDELAPQAKRSINLRYRNDHLPPEIASRMSCTVQSINVTLSRARSFLRDCVQRKLAENPH